ncbi:MAG: DUF2815 family protein [Alphaproteobacteria bacterium]|nr:DUF2815 family protein [Alphaproteobacteria bacterium]
MAVTHECRVSYVHVFEAQKNDLSGEMEYSVVGIFPANTDFTSMKKDAEEALVKKFGADKKNWPENLRNPFRKCKERWSMKDGKQVIPAGYENGDDVFITFKKAAKNGKPGVVDHNVMDIIEPQHFYSGCYAKISYNAYAFDKKGNKGAGFGLNNIQKTRDGDPLGGRSRPTDDFKPVEGAGAAAGGAGAGSVFD